MDTDAIRAEISRLEAEKRDLDDQLSLNNPYANLGFPRYDYAF